MFYCNECKDQNEWPESIHKSVGTCEICNKSAECNDVPVSKLSRAKVGVDIKKLKSILLLVAIIMTLDALVYIMKIYIGAQEGESMIRILLYVVSTVISMWLANYLYVTSRRL